MRHNRPRKQNNQPKRPTNKTRNLHKLRTTNHNPNPTPRPNQKIRSQHERLGKTKRKLDFISNINYNLAKFN